MNALAIPVNQEEINRFHFTDRRLYAILALELCWNPSKALSIITFWISMERLGFRNTVVNILSLPTQVINSFAREAITCLNFINALPVQSSSHIYIPLTQLIISKRICLQFFVEKRAIIFHHRTEVTNQVCHRALMDIMTEAQDRNDAWLRAERDMVISPLPCPTLLGGGNEHHDKRTLLVAFSRRYPVVEQEMRNFFAGHYGKCIESLFMQEVKLCEEPMYARIVLYDVSTIDAILAGKEKASFHGRDYQTFEDSWLKVDDCIASGTCIFLLGMVRSKETRNSGRSLMAASSLVMLIGENRYLDETDRIIASLPDPASLIGGEGFLTLPSVHPNDRTLFVTFSRGYPVTEEELFDFFTRYYDVSVESVYMQVVKPGRQSLHARVVLYSPDVIEDILAGQVKAKFAINGKHAWMRKFVPKDKSSPTVGNRLMSHPNASMM